ncbi:MAG TPA: phosphoglycerate kinase, partial [Pengzhenrongella sp.]
MLTIDDLGNLRGKRVLVRCDLNVPLDGTTITDDGRVRAAVPTLLRLIDAGARVVVAAHLGRPKGAPEAKYSLAPVATRLGELLGVPVALATDTVGDSAKATVAALKDGEVALLENIRFDPRETSKDDAVRASLADDLAQLADAYVSDGFGVVHRKQASVYDIAMKLPAAVGGLVLKEVEALRKATENPARPYVVVLGGSKVSDKLGVIANLLGKADRLLIGGGMVYTFLAAQGHSVGTSLLEKDQIETVKGYLALAKDKGVEIVLPTDIVVADSFTADAAHDVVAADAIPDGRMGLDIGPDSEELFRSKLLDAKTIVWNGPMGVFEFAAFAAGTRGLAQALVDAGARGAFSIVGGGDSAAAVRLLGFDEAAFGHISTGGGA